MKLTIETAHELIINMRAYFQTNSARQNYTDEEPLRAELFSLDQMDHYGKTLSESHELSKKPVPDKLLNRLADNEKVLNAVRKLLVEAIKKNHIIPPAGEWLIDNFYLIEEQIRTAKKHLPEGYSEKLPQLINVTLPGLTRVYDIALKIISHSDGRIDHDRLSSFIKSYQSVTQLQLGELWAIPIMLRLTLIENLRRVCSLIAIDMIDKNLADYWAKQMLEIAENDPKGLILITADMARSNPPMVSAFVSEMSRQLLGKGSALALPLTWIEQRLIEEGRTSNEVVNAEIQKQAINQVSVSNSIGSLRLLSSQDWRDFVEEHSIVDQTLRLDSGGIYAGMDFSTRDNYRHVIEHLSKKSKLSEIDVANIALQLAGTGGKNNIPDDPKAHVGYYLIGKGRDQTIKLAGLRTSFAMGIKKVLRKNSLFAYLGVIILITLNISACFLMIARTDTANQWLLALIGTLLILSSSQLAVTIVNFFTTLIVKPQLLPRMDFSGAIPDKYRTLIVIPAILTNPQSIEDLVEALEVRFLANRDNNLHFGLLTDFTDAREETLPEDQPLLQLVQQRIQELKKKYENGKRDIFFLFHRPRQWNVTDKIWMGYERKRGKLSELNALLRGNSSDRFSCIVGDLILLQQVKYVITLDSDTQLPRGSAWKMIATMAHPLNHPFYDEKKKRVTGGYGVLQPRVTVSLPESNSSFYSRLHGNEPGIDPYTRATSDVYQDLFGEGSFIGKGIYEIDSFETVLKGKFLENRILSHDLIEGCYVRSGLLSDVELYEKYPMSYHLDMKRRSRWIRGDWQIFSWALPFIPGADRRLHKNPVSALSKWKIFDNIRRSLIPIALTVLIILGWTVLNSPLFWTISVTGIIIFPIFITLIWDTFKKPGDVNLSHHLTLLLRTAGNIIIQTLFSLICLPYEAYINFVAILRTIWRMLISHKRLLEWDPSTNVESISKNSLEASYSAMGIAPFLSLTILLYLSIYAPASLLIAGPVVFLWVLSPFITWFASKPAAKQKTLITDKQNIFLLQVARKTWAFFERFVGIRDNWLPPDNFQQHPVEVIAHRTSPTNIGLSLLANLTAHDFGYISTDNFLERTDGTIRTMKKMERYKGHFYNWYDTESLQPLPPKYISTVDSGNLAGHLLTLRQGLFEILHKKIAGPKIFEGLLDTLRVFKETLTSEDLPNLNEFTSILERACDVRPITVVGIRDCLDRLSISYKAVLKNLNAEAGSLKNWWRDILLKQIDQAIDDILIFSPWYSLPPASNRFNTLIELDSEITLHAVCIKAFELIPLINVLISETNTNEETEWLDTFKASVIETQQRAKERIAFIENLGHECIDLADMEWNFLYEKSKHLLSIGYKVEENISDPGYYDLLASEARLCTFVAIAQGKLPEESWFALGRLLTKAGRDPILLSWSGSMFEYLMPLLVMPTYDNTLLDQTYKAMVRRQIEYGKQRRIPWGISECGYNMVDINSNYQYRAFGVPGLGLKRGLEVDLVIAPYATALSLMVAPEVSCQNLELLSDQGFEGAYGLYEAIDYTPSRLQRGQAYTVIQSFMAHHQGMSFLSFGYLLHGQPMQRRFEAEPQFQATLLLLQERIPKASSFYAHTTDMGEFNNSVSGTDVRLINTPNTFLPEVQLLSNGKYHVMVTNAGGGYSRWKDIAITRWREDVTCDNWGSFCYIRDVANGQYWSNTHQPTVKNGESYEVAFSQSRVDFHSSNNNIEAHTEIVISPEDDIEMRRIRFTNRSNMRRTIEITSYAEVVLASPASDAMQPAFSNLFVQTEILPLQHAIICSRRPRSADEQVPWMFHSMIIHGMEKRESSYETDRMEFLGHGNTVANPAAMNNSGPLSGNQGSVLDPIVAIRTRVVLEPGENITVDLIIGVSETREICEGLIEKYQDKHHKDRVFELAWTHSQVILRQINATEADAQLFGRLASSVIYVNPLLRADPSVIIKNRRGQSGLWGYSISGDLPIVLLQIEDQGNIQLAKQLIQAHTYWRLKGLIVDLVIWNEDHGGYRQIFQNQIQALIPSELMDRPGGVFVRVADQISNEDRILFQTVARINISDTFGTLADHINRKVTVKSMIPYISQPPSYAHQMTSVPSEKNLIFFNGLGGFSPEGSEYIITIDNKNRTPAPWVNVIANPVFGTVISESGQAYTWSENAHEMRLTPWNNDPVSDSAGEIFYLRDEEAGHFWSVTPLPRGGQSSYCTKHGLGYSVFEHVEDGIHSEMSVYVDLDSPIKFIVLKVRNNSGRPRRLSATGYIEWVLGDRRPKTAMYIITEIDPGSGAFFARNPYSTEFSDSIAFFDVDEVTRTFTGDRTEFLGRNRSLQNPEAMYRLKLSGKVGVALDPCAAIQIPFDLPDGKEREIIFKLGIGKDINHVRDIINQFRGADAAHDALKKVRNYWKHTTAALQVETPDTAINIMANGWLTYQTLSCRLWGRSGFYQSGGAFGFRDQLQDILSLLHAQPQLARKQILLCATRQFQEGDVQHWWHPPTGHGVRTHISDDFLWLPLVTCRYIQHTGDTNILDELLLFLEGRPLNAAEDSYYALPTQSQQPATLYDHCVKAIKHGFSYGKRGLPLMGTGDWNDGMDRVGREGKGESIWLGFFFYDVLTKFIAIANLHNDPGFATQCKKEADGLSNNIEKNGWDGEWYRRAYFDDGTPLGSASNAECQIDSISQSWSVLSGAGNMKRSLLAMEAAEKRLVKKDAALIQLLDPPFDKANIDPGYIKGYVPGVRENGGQYTHAAIWMIMAFAKLGDNQRTWELLQMINPINHGRSHEEIAIYKVEPYVVAGDVYAFAPHTGRGGWTWYSGSASWMYQLIIESFLGLVTEVDKLRIKPCIPVEWPFFKVHYRHGNTIYHILIQQKNMDGEMTVMLDGLNQEDNAVSLVDDMVEHFVEVEIFTGKVSDNLI
jgi:cyclic beta-1,2-glucan synthetase